MAQPSTRPDPEEEDDGVPGGGMPSGMRPSRAQLTVLMRKAAKRAPVVREQRKALAGRDTARVWESGPQADEVIGHDRLDRRPKQG